MEGYFVFPSLLKIKLSSTPLVYTQFKTCFELQCSILCIGIEFDTVYNMLNYSNPNPVLVQKQKFQQGSLNDNPNAMT